MFNRRNVSGYIVDAKAQLRFLFPFATLLLISLAMNIYLFWNLSWMKNQVVEAYGPANLPLSMAAENILQQALTVSMGGVFLLCALSIGFWLVYTHRIFGPQVPILRHIRKLIDGKYEGEIKLRKGDEYQPVAEELNRLTQVLGGKNGFSLIEVLITVAIASIGFVAMTTLMTMSGRQQNQSNLTFQADSFRRSLISALNNADGWKNTYKDASNNQASLAQMDCLMSPHTAPCTVDQVTDLPSGGTPITSKLINKIFDASGALIYDSSTPGSGLTTQGLPCVGYVAFPATGSDRCPLRFEVMWRPKCKCANPNCTPVAAADTCRNPQVQLKINALYNPGSKTDRLAFNPANYSTPEYLQGQVPGGFQSANNTLEDGSVAITTTGSQNKFVTTSVNLTKGIFIVDFYNCMDTSSAAYFSRASAEATAGTIYAGGLNFQVGQLEYYDGHPFIMKVLSDTATVNFYVKHEQGGTIQYGTFPCSGFHYTKIGI